MTVLYFILTLLAVVCFIATAFGVVAVRRINLLALGLFFWVLVDFIQLLQKL